MCFAQPETGGLCGVRGNSLVSVASTVACVPALPFTCLWPHKLFCPPISCLFPSRLPNMCPVSLWEGVASHDDPCAPRQTQILTKLQVSAIGELAQCLYCHNLLFVPGNVVLALLCFSKNRRNLSFCRIVELFFGLSTPY